MLLETDLGKVGFLLDVMQGVSSLIEDAVLNLGCGLGHGLKLVLGLLHHFSWLFDHIVVEENVLKGLCLFLDYL